MAGLYQVTRSEEFDEASPWLIGPVRELGYCCGDDHPDVERLCWIDFAAPLWSGSKVTLALESKHLGIVLAGKILQFTRDGRPWLLNYGTHDLTTLVAVPLDHPMLRVLAIGADVMKLHMPRSRSKPYIPDDPMWIHLAQISAPACREWRTRGFPPRRRLPVINHQENIDYLRSIVKCHH